MIEKKDQITDFSHYLTGIQGLNMYSICEQLS